MTAEKRSISVRRGLVATLVALGVMVTASLWVWLTSDGTGLVPVHWDVNGEADGFAPLIHALVAMPLITIFISVILAGAAKLEPRQAHMKHSTVVYNTAWLGVLGLLIVTHLATLASAAGLDIPVARFIYAAIGVLFVALGDVIGKTKSNFTVGMRTPWTLSSERSWSKTNRAGGRLMVLTGIAGAISAFVFPPAVTFAVYMVCAAVLVVFTLVYSWLIWRREQEGTAE